MSFNDKFVQRINEKLDKGEDISFSDYVNYFKLTQ